ncbi:hypothetical protein [Streptomyces oceani]|uniref:CbbX AAA lid domain-containing protein n=1 Tax=Streptomyces oceani TaxID=1075402 RepID=A0A1E7KKP8_9ACTN|nr:hypothetical protein [Streptomyces oceani]OEV04508.1 hypothetical protein AN216_06200 [Streptomyces oceani]
MVVVLVGYPHEITELLASNPGLVSRFTTRVDFPSYSAEELAQIDHGVLEEHGDVMDEDAVTVLEACCKRAVEEGLVDRLGKGRLARELCRKAAALRDLRRYETHGDSGTLTRSEITTVRVADLSQAFRELSDCVTAP